MARKSKRRRMEDVASKRERTMRRTWGRGRQKWQENQGGRRDEAENEEQAARMRLEVEQRDGKGNANEQARARKRK